VIAARGWLTPLRWLLLATVALCGIALTIANHRTSLSRIQNGYSAAVTVSAALSADGVRDWIVMRHAQAALLASVAAADPTRDATARAMRIIIEQGAFSEGQRIDSPAPRAQLRARQLNDSVTALDFSAPIVRNGERIGWIVLTAKANEAAFSHLNVSEPSDLTQRSTLWMSTPDSIVLLTSSTPGGGARPDQYARSSPADIQPDAAYRAAVLNREQAVANGPAIGLAGRPVMFARVPVPETPLMLVREREVEELIGRFRPSMLISAAIFLFVTALIVGVTAALWRGAYLSRENQSQQLRSAFISSVSHELRTPLTQIRMYAEMLRLGLLATPADSARALGVIEKESERLSMLVERALSMTRGGEIPAPEPNPVVDVADAVRAAIVTVAPLAAERQSVLAADVANSVTARIEPDSLHQILLNLLDNAIKYGPRGQTIQIAATTDGRVSHLTVTDQGPGVTSEERESIWKPFTRGRLAERGDEVGSGIGLAVVHDLVTRVGGRAYVEALTPSSGGKDAAASGARFVVELPSGPAA
jgi:signal transduction histidine kinase